MDRKITYAPGTLVWINDTFLAKAIAWEDHSCDWCEANEDAFQPLEIIDAKRTNHDYIGKVSHWGHSKLTLFYEGLVD